MSLGTPIRNHVKFPAMKKKNQASKGLLSGEKAELNKKTPARATNACREKSSVKPPIQTNKKPPATNLCTHKRSICLPERPDSSKKHKTRDIKSCTEGLPTLGAESEKR